jgi:DNA mismatch endonuclease (patch repair protein)
MTLAIFVDGCFWHQCPRHSNIPANNREFWERKLAGNQRRDRLVLRTLRAKGWYVLRVWEHELSRRNEKRLLARLRRAMG